jgi:sugar lactone lactonase YvrE
MRSSNKLLIAITGVGLVACGPAVRQAPSAPQNTQANQSALSSTEPPVGTIVNFGPDDLQAVFHNCREPEGIALDGERNVYLSENSDELPSVGYICKLDRNGNLVDEIPVPAGATGAVQMLGEMWENGHVLVVDQGDGSNGAGRLIRVNPDTHEVTVLAVMTEGGGFPNDIREDARGNLYVTDSNFGQIFKFSPDGLSRITWLQSPLFVSNDPSFPVGVNDEALNREGDRLYVDVTGNRQLFAVHINDDGSAGEIELIADGAAIDAELGLPSPTSMYGADGLKCDEDGNIYMAANHAEEIQVYSPKGKLLHRYSGQGNNFLDFPASLQFVGDDVYISNGSAATGGVNSKVSILEAPERGLPLH